MRTNAYSLKAILVTYAVISASVALLNILANTPLNLALLLSLVVLGPIAFLAVVPLSDTTALPLLVAYVGGTLLFFVPFFVCRKFALMPSFGGNVLFGILWFGIGSLSVFVAFTG